MNPRCFLIWTSFACLASSVAADDLRVGIIGLDTSHVVAFTKLLNDPKDPNHVGGAKVIAAYKGGSADIESSASGWRATRHNSGTSCMSRSFRRSRSCVGRSMPSC